MTTLPQTIKNYLKELKTLDVRPIKGYYDDDIITWDLEHYNQETGEYERKIKDLYIDAFNDVSMMDNEHKTRFLSSLQQIEEKYKEFWKWYVSQYNSYKNQSFDAHAFEFELRYFFQNDFRIEAGVYTPQLYLTPTFFSRLQDAVMVKSGTLSKFIKYLSSLSVAISTVKKENTPAKALLECIEPQSTILFWNGRKPEEMPYAFRKMNDDFSNWFDDQDQREEITKRFEDELLNGHITDIYLNKIRQSWSLESYYQDLIKWYTEQHREIWKNSLTKQAAISKTYPFLQQWVSEGRTLEEEPRNAWETYLFLANEANDASAALKVLKSYCQAALWFIGRSKNIIENWESAKITTPPVTTSTPPLEPVREPTPKEITTPPVATSTEAKEPNKELTFDALFSGDSQKAFVIKAMKDLQMTDINGVSNLGERDKAKLLAFIHGLIQKKIIPKKADTKLVPLFAQKIGLECGRLRKESYVYTDFLNEVLSHLNK